MHVVIQRTKRGAAHPVAYLYDPMAAQEVADLFNSKPVDGTLYVVETWAASIVAKEVLR